MMDTLACPARHLLEVKHSRFLAQAVAIASTDAAQQALPGLNDTDASHNCWAWRIGDQYRSSDDGEPAGTAGRPILAAIDGQGYDRILVIVTRWFGGIKLGAGGLVRAYGGAAAECLRRAERHPLVRTVDLIVNCDFADIGSVHAVATALSAQKLGETFDPSGARLRLRIAEDRAADLKTRLRDATRNRVGLELDDSANKRSDTDEAALPAAQVSIRTLLERAF
jgi:putative IMPACT (imprinted ancient) family translation regulator